MSSQNTTTARVKESEEVKSADKCNTERKIVEELKVEDDFVNFGNVPMNVET